MGAALRLSIRSYRVEPSGKLRVVGHVATPQGVSGFQSVAALRSELRRRFADRTDMRLSDIPDGIREESPAESNPNTRVVIDITLEAADVGADQIIVEGFG